MAYSLTEIIGNEMAYKEEDSGVLEWRTEMARRMRLAVESSGLTAQGFADRYNKLSPRKVTGNGVAQWMTTGRWRKWHIPYLAAVTGETESYWLGAEVDESAQQLSEEARAFARHWMSLGPDAKARWASSLNEQVTPRPTLPATIQGIVDKLQGLPEPRLARIVQVIDVLVADMAPARERPPSKEYQRQTAKAA